MFFRKIYSPFCWDNYFPPKKEIVKIEKNKTIADFASTAASFGNRPVRLSRWKLAQSRKRTLKPQYFVISGPMLPTGLPNFQVSTFALSRNTHAVREQCTSQRCPLVPFLVRRASASPVAVGRRCRRRCVSRRAVFPGVKLKLPGCHAFLWCAARLTLTATPSPTKLNGLWMIVVIVSYSDECQEYVGFCRRYASTCSSTRARTWLTRSRDT